MKSALAAAALLLATAATPAAAQRRIELPARDQPLRAESRTLFSVGEMDGHDYENFGMVNDAAFDRHGNLYVLDALGYRIVVFDTQGRFLRSIGRQGGGPGEFTFPASIAVVGDELIVNDGGRGALQVFDLRGDFVRSVTVDEDLGRAGGRLLLSDAGTLITETFQPRRLMDAQRPSDGSRITLPPRSISALRVDAEATGRRLYNTPPRQISLSSTAGTGAGSVRFSGGNNGFEPRTLWTTAAGGGIAALSGAEYRITLVDDQGKPQHYLERAIAPRKVTAADRKAWLANRGRGAAGGAGVMVVSSAAGSAAGGTPAAPPPAVMRAEVPQLTEKEVNWAEVVPVIEALGTDAAGRLWVQRSLPGLVDGPIDVIGPDLRYLGTLSAQAMPRAFGPGGLTATIERDEYDVQRVVVRRVTF